MKEKKKKIKLFGIIVYWYFFLGFLDFIIDIKMIIGRKVKESILFYFISSG